MAKSWRPAPFDPNFPPTTKVKGQQETLCCGAAGGVIQADHSSGEFICSMCRRVLDTADLLDMVGVATKPMGTRMVPVTGNTYPVKDELKQLGARWDAASRVWKVPDSRLADAQRIVARGPLPNNPPWNTPGPQSRPTSPSPSTDPFETPEQRRYREFTDQTRTRPLTLETRLCWECATPFSEEVVAIQNGDWDGYWCGCTEKPRLKK